MTGNACIVQINGSAGGVPKLPVPSAGATAVGLQGDAHRDRQHDGGLDRALCLFSHERIRALQAEGQPIAAGSIGENLTIDGLDWSAVTPGSYLLLGSEVVAQVTRYTSPCTSITGAFRDRNYSRVSQKRHPGDSWVYARALQEGPLTSGDPVALLTEAEALSPIGSR